MSEGGWEGGLGRQADFDRAFKAFDSLKKIKTFRAPAPVCVCVCVYVRTSVRSLWFTAFPPERANKAHISKDHTRVRINTRHLPVQPSVSSPSRPQLALNHAAAATVSILNCQHPVHNRNSEKQPRGQRQCSVWCYRHHASQ